MIDRYASAAARSLGSAGGAAAAAAASRSRLTRRRTALTRPAALRLPALPARSTASFTAADAGIAIEVQQLEDRQPEDVEDFGIELAQRPSGKRARSRDRTRPASAACRWRSRRPARDRVRPAVGSACARERRRQIGPSGAHRAQHLVGGDRAGASTRSLPGDRAARLRRAWPARNSRAVITRLPSGWISRIRSTRPSPAATARTPSDAAVIGSGAARRVVSSVNAVR